MINKDDLNPYVILTKNIAIKTGINPILLLAIIYQESGGRPWVTRFEPNYKYLFQPQEYAAKLNYSLESEICLQRTSFGLCQIMGSVAREVGGHESYLPELFLPTINLTISAKYLMRLAVKYGSTANTIASYNAGSPRKAQDGSLYVNQDYVDSVISHMGEISRWNI